MPRMLLSIIICTACLGALGAQEVRLAGIVVDAAGAPVDGALVRLLGADLTAVTGMDGRWTIDEGHPRALFPSKLTSGSGVSWAGPGQPLRASAALTTWFTVLCYDAEGQQIGRQHLECQGELNAPLDIPADTALVSITSQACDRVAIRIDSAGRAHPVFSTCSTTEPGTAPDGGFADILEITRIGHGRARVPLAGYANDPAAGTVPLPTDTRTPIAVTPASWPQVLAGLRGGELVEFASGDYGALEMGSDSGFADWVTLRAAPEAEPVFQRIRIGDRSSNTDGDGDAWLQVQGFTIADGVHLGGTRHVQLHGCAIRRQGEIIGSKEDIEKSGVFYRESRGIWIDGCDVTQTGIGINGWGNHIVYRRNHVHHISHDGLHYHGGHDFLCEYNDVHDMEDGAADSEKAEKPWNMHCDALHIYPIWGNDEPRNWMADMCFRGNRFYRPECQGWMIQSKTPNQFKRALFENNITTAVPGYMFHFKDPIDGVIVRFNSFIIPDEGFRFTGIFGREFDTSGGSLNWVAVASWGKQTTFSEVYGNIMGHGTDFDGPHLRRCDNNIYFSSAGITKRKAPLGPGERIVTEQPFVDPFAIDALPTEASGVIARGLVFDDEPGTREQVPLPAYDASGRPRGKRVTLGAIDPHAIDVPGAEPYRTRQPQPHQPQ